MSLLLTAFCIGAGLYLVLCLYLYFNQKNMTFFPNRQLMCDPAELGFKYENVNLPVDGDTVHAWYFPAPGGQHSKLVLFSHGNAGNISHRIESIDFFLQLGAAVLIFDYRGYGLSTGEPSEEKIYADIDACFDWLTNEKGCQSADIVLFGRSLGGAVAVDLASRKPAGGLIVESSFTSAGDVGRRIFPILPVKLLLRYKFDSLEKIRKVICPVIVTHSPDDDVIPFAMGEALFNAAPEPKQFIRLSGRHNDREYLRDAKYVEAIKGMVNK